MPALSGPELVTYRKHRHAKKNFLAIVQYNTIYTARLNQVFTSNDLVSQIEYNSGSGTLANVRIDMTMYVGSSAGAYDLGMVRIRATPDANTFFIGEVSDVDWVNNAACYLTIVDDYQLRQKPLKIVSGDTYMDTNIAFSTQYDDFKPVPVLGTHIPLVLDEITGEAECILGPGPDYPSWVIGSTITDYLWDIPGALSIDDDTLENPTVTFDTPGTYPCYCTVTAANGEEEWGVRYVVVFDADNPPITDFTPSNRRADYEKGNWTFDIAVHSGAEATEIRDHSLVILFSQNYVDGSLTDRPAPIPGTGHVECVGYVGRHSLSRNFEKGTASFHVEAAGEWMKKMTVTQFSLQFATNTPSTWNTMPELTPTKAMWQYLYYHTTACRVMDVTLPPDELYTPSFEFLQPFIWDQLKEVASKIFANVGVDAYGRLFVQVDPQMVPEADRSWDIIQDIEEQDWQGLLIWDIETETEIAITSIASMFTNSSGASVTYWSLSPGHIPKQFGMYNILEIVPLAESQTDSNTLCGLYAGWKNNRMKRLEVSFVANYRAADLWPRQYFSMTIDPSDDPRGLGYEGNLIPREIYYTLDTKSGYEYPVVNFEPETFPDIAIDGDIPASTGIENFDDISNLSGADTFPDFDLDFAPIYLPPTEPTERRAKIIVIGTTVGVLYTENADEPDITKILWKVMNDGLSTNERTQIGELVVTPGRQVYIMTDGSPSTGYAVVKRAASLGAPWTTVFTATDRVYEGASRSVRICGLGVNRYVSDQIGIVDSVAYIAFGANTTGRFYVGSTSFGSGTSFFNKQYTLHNAVVFEANKWFVYCTRPTGIGGSGSTPYVFRFSSAGSAETEADFSTGPGEGSAHYRGLSRAGKMYLWVSNNRYCIALPDLSFTNYPSSTTGMDFSGVQAMSVSPTGVYGMGADDTGSFTPYRTVDSIVTWSSAAGTIPVGSDVWENCMHDMIYLFGGGTTGPRYTTDQGVTYIELTGNLGYIAPTRDLTHIRFVA